MLGPLESYNYLYKKILISQSPLARENTFCASTVTGTVGVS